MASRGKPLELPWSVGAATVGGGRIWSIGLQQRGSGHPAVGGEGPRVAAQAYFTDRKGGTLLRLKGENVEAGGESFTRLVETRDSHRIEIDPVGAGPAGVAAGGQFGGRGIVDGVGEDFQNGGLSKSGAQTQAQSGNGVGIVRIGLISRQTWNRARTT